MRRLDGDFQPLIVEYAVIVIPSVLDRMVSTFRALRRFVCVLEVVKEQNRFVFALAWPRVLVATGGGGGAVLLPPTLNLRFVLLS